MSENPTEKKVITPNQRKAIECLLTTGNTTAAAESAGVNRSTIYRWMSDDGFLDSLHEAEREAVAALSRALSGLGDMASSALRDALQPHQKIATRLRASEIVIGNLLRLRELVDIEARLTTLERNQR
jgi:hypothetical protein